MTRIAIAHPKPIKQRAATRLMIKDCTHEGGCPCWLGLSRQPAKVVNSLIKRGLIDRDDDYNLTLTKRGWEVLHNSKGAPVSVDSWDDDGPLDYTIRRSFRPDFRVLY